MYTKVRGHHCWWLAKDGKSIGHFNIDSLTSDSEAEGYVDEIIKIESDFTTAVGVLTLVILLMTLIDVQF